MSPGELKKAQKPTKVFEDCGCVEEAWRHSNGSAGLSEKWIKNDHLPGWDYPSSDTVAAAKAQLEGVVYFSCPAFLSSWSYGFGVPPPLPATKQSDRRVHKVVRKAQGGKPTGKPV